MAQQEFLRMYSTPEETLKVMVRQLNHIFNNLSAGNYVTLPPNSVNDTIIDWGTGTNQVSMEDIPNVPHGNIAATNGQTAINELEDEKQPKDETLTALAGYNTNGLVTQTAPDTFTGRTITGTTNRVNVVNGDGVSGNPILSLPQDIHITANPTFGNLTIGTGEAGTDYTLTFNGETNDGVLTWMEDEDYFKSSDDIMIDSTEKIYFRDTALSIHSQADGYLNIVSDSGTRLGDATPTNYTQFDGTGHQTMVGTAKPWDDLRIEPIARATGANAPTFEQWADDSGIGDTGTSRGIFLYSFDDATAPNEKEIHFTMQMPHSWDGGAIHIHVHWIGAVNDTTSAPRWGLEYAFKEIGGTFGGTLTIYTDGTNYTQSGTDANVTAGIHYISAFSTITPDATQDGLSSILVGRLFRNSSDAGDTYDATGAKCGLLYIDAHYQLNSLGSTDEYTK